MDQHNASSFNDSRPSGRTSYSMAQLLCIVTVTASLSIVTVLGNALVMLSIRVNRRLQTVNNYFLFSLAAADLLIGLVSMNLYTLYMVRGHWPLGPALCDLWLVVDYVVSSASVMNLLLVSLDRYLCVTRPLSFPAQWSPAVAGGLISGAWLLPVLLWAPAILCWQTLTGKRIVPDGECYVQLLASPAVTMATTLLSFYLPVFIMTWLYSRVSLASRRLLGSQGPRASRPSVKDCLLNRRVVACELETRMASDTLNPSESSRGSWKPSSNKSPSSGTEESQPGSLRQASVCEGRRRHVRLQRERKVTKTVLAIMFTFILTWTPYNVMAVVGAFCQVCVPSTLWSAGYWLCYVNSTINPGCYALCNNTFRKTFCRLLRCYSRHSPRDASS